VSICNTMLLNPKNKDEKCRVPTGAQVAVLAPSKGSSARLWHRKGLARKIRMKTAFVKRSTSPINVNAKDLQSMTQPSLPLLDSEPMWSSEGSEIATANPTSSELVDSSKLLTAPMPIGEESALSLTSEEPLELQTCEQSLKLQAAQPSPTSASDPVSFSRLSTTDSEPPMPIGGESAQSLTGKKSPQLQTGEQSLKLQTAQPVPTSVAEVGSARLNDLKVIYGLGLMFNYKHSLDCRSRLCRSRSKSR